MLLLKAIYDFMEDTNSYKEMIYKSYFINEFESDQNKKLKLKLMKSDDGVFINLMKNNNIEEKESNVYKNYIYFKKLLENTDLILEQIYTGIHKLSIVYIALDRNRDNPQLIFESINSTGLSLNDGDLIRNFMLMDKKIEEQEIIYREYWKVIEDSIGSENISNFIRDYLTMKTDIISKKNDVYQFFKKYVREKYSEGETSTDVLEELCFFVEFYEYFLKNNSSNEKVNKYLRNIKKLKQTVVYPFLLFIFEDNYKRNLDNDELIKILKLIESYIFRRSVCEISTSALNKIFGSLKKELLEISNYQENYYENIVAILLNKRNSGIFPENISFKEKFLQRDMYKFRSIKYLLEELENFGNKEKVLTEDLSIEHVMPQNLNSNWKIELGNNWQETHSLYLHNIGNLTLSGYNGELGNKSFKDKKKILFESKLKLNSHFANLNSWNKKSIENRAENLYKIAEKIWNFPELSNEYLESIHDKGRGFYTLEDEINVTGEVPIVIKLIEKKINIKSWRDMWLYICNQMYELDSMKFLEFTKDEDFLGKKNRIITLNENECRDPEVTGERIYIEKNLNANSILNYSRMVLEKYCLAEDFMYWLQ